MTQKNYTILFSFIVFSLFTACSGSSKEESGTEGTLHTEFLTQVKTVKATLSNQETEMTLTGKVISDPDKTVHYVPLVSGVIDRTWFSLGERVKKGQKLMDIRSTELSALEADLIGAESDVTVARREVQTARSMHSDGILSERELLEAEAQLKQAEALRNKLAADISVFGSSRGAGLFTVSSPIDGYIISKSVATGSTVSAEGEPAFAIADLSSVWIIANVYASNLSFVREGMEAIITTLSYPGQEFPAKITALSQVFDPEDKALKARIVMDNPELKLKPEMSVVITLREKYTGHKTAVPSDVLIFDNDAYYTVVEEADNRFSIRQVVPAGHSGNTTFLASGLSEGEKVVSANQLLIYSELKGK